MTKAHDRLIKKIRSRSFEKFISVAHNDNGDDFIQEVLLVPLQFLFVSAFMFFYLCFMYIPLHYTIHFCILTVISPPSLSQIWLLRNCKRWQLHMWMLPLRLDGFGGGILPLRSKPKTSSPLLFFFTRKPSMTGLTKLFFWAQMLQYLILFNLFSFSLCHL